MQPRSCDEAASFEECKKEILNSLSLTHEEFDEAYLFPLQQLIVYNPEIYGKIDGTRLHIFATTPTAHYPSIRFAYTYDDERITLWYAELKEPKDE